MKLAEKFGLPDLPSSTRRARIPGIGAEERGQSEAIARNLFVMSTLKVPIISVVIGEGGSGGALAIGVGDRVLMLEYSDLFGHLARGVREHLVEERRQGRDRRRGHGHHGRALHGLKLVDDVIPEPLGGAHRDTQAMADSLKRALTQTLATLARNPARRAARATAQADGGLRSLQRGLSSGVAGDRGAPCPLPVT